jgi:hypothetical protein
MTIQELAPRRIDLVWRLYKRNPDGSATYETDEVFEGGRVQTTHMWMGRSVAECLRWANIVGGLSTLGLGGTGRCVTAEEVARCIDDQENEGLA